MYTPVETWHVHQYKPVRKSFGNFCREIEAKSGVRNLTIRQSTKFVTISFLVQSDISLF